MKSRDDVGWLDRRKRSADECYSSILRNRSRIKRWAPAYAGVTNKSAWLERVLCPCRPTRVKATTCTPSRSDGSAAGDGDRRVSCSAAAPAAAVAAQVDNAPRHFECRRHKRSDGQTTKTPHHRVACRPDTPP